MNRIIYTGLINDAGGRGYDSFDGWKIKSLHNMYKYSDYCNAGLNVITRDNALFREFLSRNEQHGYFNAWSAATMSSIAAIYEVAKTEHSCLLWLDLDILPNRIQGFPTGMDWINLSDYSVDYQHGTEYDENKRKFFNYFKFSDSKLFRKVKSCIFLFSSEICKTITQFLKDNHLDICSHHDMMRIKEWSSENGFSPNDESLIEICVSQDEVLKHRVQNNRPFAEIFETPHDYKADFVHFGSNTKTYMMNFKDWQHG